MTGDVFASILITTRNRQTLVVEAIESALCSQTPDLEVVVVDDFSEDETPIRIAAIQEPRLRFHRLESRKGRVGARNFGVSLTRGEVLIFLDDDDRFLPDGLDVLVQAIRNAPATVSGVYAIPRYVTGNPKGGFLRVEKHLPGLGSSGSIMIQLLTQNFIQPGAVAIRKGAFLEVGGFTGDVEPIALEDWRLWLQIAARGQFAYLDQEVAQILRHDGNTPEDLFTQSKCEYFGSSEFEHLLNYKWIHLTEPEKESIRLLLLKYAASSQGREQFALARKLTHRARRYGAISPFFGKDQLWRSWIPRFWKKPG